MFFVTRDIERFHSLAPMYYRNAAAAVVVYDITKAVSANTYYDSVCGI